MLTPYHPTLRSAAQNVKRFVRQLHKDRANLRKTLLGTNAILGVSAPPPGVCLTCITAPPVLLFRAVQVQVKGVGLSREGAGQARLVPAQKQRCRWRLHLLVFT
jgi:hypothetical protein